MGYKDSSKWVRKYHEPPGRLEGAELGTAAYRPIEFHNHDLTMPGSKRTIDLLQRFDTPKIPQKNPEALSPSDSQR